MQMTFHQQSQCFGGHARVHIPRRVHKMNNVSVASHVRRYADGAQVNLLDARVPLRGVINCQDTRLAQALLYDISSNVSQKERIVRKHDNLLALLHGSDNGRLRLRTPMSVQTGERVIQYRDEFCPVSSDEKPSKVEGERERPLVPLTQRRGKTQLSV